MAASNAHLTFDQAVGIVEKRIVGRLGISEEGGRLEAVWPWAVALERSIATWNALEEGLRVYSATSTEVGGEADEEVQTPGLLNAIRRFVTTDVVARSPSRRQVRELAEIALCAPGNVLYRVVSRLFEESSDLTKRIAAVSTVSIGSLRAYLDLPDFHVLFRTREHRQYPAAIRKAIWDGNLESTLDEHLATLRGLGLAERESGDQKHVLELLSRALMVGAGSVTVHQTGTGSRGDSFRMRCHAALAFGLGGQEKETGTGELHGDALRISFNSPFRPHALVTTSIGQEGLDFHVWSQHVVHWDLPSNPIDLEQREGRIDRYGGLAIRRALARGAANLPREGSPWRVLAESQREAFGGLGPWWVCDGATIRRSVLIPPFSRITDDLQRLRGQLSLYRMALGQADQEALIQVLQRRTSEAGENEAAVLAWFEKARIDLSPRILADSSLS